MSIGRLLEAQAQTNSICLGRVLHLQPTALCSTRVDSIVRNVEPAMGQSVDRLGYITRRQLQHNGHRHHYKSLPRGKTQQYFDVASTQQTRVSPALSGTANSGPFACAARGHICLGLSTLVNRFSLVAVAVIGRHYDELWTNLLIN